MPHRRVQEECKTDASKHLAVVSKCLAIVLIHKSHKRSSRNIFQTCEVTIDTTQSSEAFKAPSSGYNGKELLKDFKQQNKTCYWNQSLLDSIKGLEYKGFVEPSTILVSGKDIHLENLRSAWGRRVLKAPDGFIIERIGDVSGIQMQVIPQTQFMPLSDALCSIIMELNLRHVVATLELIWEKLKVWYKEMTPPPQPMVIETLGNLIRDRKVFHSGSGYCVVTPDTSRPHNSVNTSYLPASPWLPYHPLYTPIYQGQAGKRLPDLPSRARTRSISCQERTSLKQCICAIGQMKQNSTRRIFSNLQSDGENVCREMEIMLESEEKDAVKVTTIEEAVEEEESSIEKKNKMKGGPTSTTRPSRPEKQCPNSQTQDQKVLAVEKGDNKVKVVNEVFKKPLSSKFKGQKTSIFSKLFNRQKRDKDRDRILMPPPPVPPAVLASRTVPFSSSCSDAEEGKEYATFSAQFPPPEWVWYQEQRGKHKQAGALMYQQTHKTRTPAQTTRTTKQSKPVIKSRTVSHRGSGNSPGPVSSGHNEYMSMLATGSQEQKYTEIKQESDDEFVKPWPYGYNNTYESCGYSNVTQKRQKSHDTDKAHQKQLSEYYVIDSSDFTPVKISDVYQSVSAISPVSNATDESTYFGLTEQSRLGPLHSTPLCRERNAHGACRIEQPDPQGKFSKPPINSHKRKTYRPQRHRHRAYNDYSGQGNDISYEYRGHLPNKNSSHVQSTDSGVNCVGLGTASEHSKRPFCPVYENIFLSDKHHRQYRERNLKLCQSRESISQFEVNATENDSKDLNSLYNVGYATSSASCDSNVTNAAYNSVVYGSNASDMPGTSVLYPTSSSSNLESVNMHLPHNSLQSDFYDESKVGFMSLDFTTPAKTITAAPPQEVVQPLSSPETVIVDVVGSPTSPHRLGFDTSELVLEQAVKREETNVQDRVESRATTSRSRSKHKSLEDLADVEISDRKDLSDCVDSGTRLMTRGKHSGLEDGVITSLSTKAYLQSLTAPASGQHDLTGRNDNLVLDSGFISPRKRAAGREEKGSDLSNSPGENSDANNSSPSYSDNSSNSKMLRSSADGSSGHHSGSDVYLASGSDL